jgi:hypothetical protein
LPLTSDDCRELKATIDVVNNEATELLKAKPGDYLTSLYGGLRVENDGGRRLIIVADATAISKFQQLIYTGSKPDPQLAASYQKAIASLRSRAIRIDDKQHQAGRHTVLQGDNFFGLSNGRSQRLARR